MSLLHLYHEDRPWGSFDRLTQNEPSTVKILRVSPGMRFSLQTHAHRSESWLVLSGEGVATVGDVEHKIGVGDTIEIPIGTAHRLTAGASELVVLEIAKGNFDENDIQRVEDDFGRI